MTLDEHEVPFFRYLAIDQRLKIDHTLHSGYRVLKKYFENKDVTKDNFSVFLYEMRISGKKDSYLNRFIKIIHHFGFYIGDEEMQKIPFFKKSSRSVYNLPTKEEIIKMADYYYPYRRYREESNHLIRTILYFIYETGARIGETLSLEWTDICEEYVVFREDKTKTSKEREMPIFPHLWELIDALPRRSKYVFANLDGRPVTQQYVNRDFHMRARENNINRKINAHILRDCFGTHCAINKMQANLVSAMLGHEDPKTTQKYYIHVQRKEFREALYRSHPMFMENQTRELLYKSAQSLLDDLIDRTKFVYRLSIEPINS